MISFKQYILESKQKTHKGTINLSNLYLKELPSFLENIEVDGDFWCDNNNLTSLKYCPKEINGHFDCSSNNLTSLKHCPEIVNGDFSCSYNNLTSLEYRPKIVNGDFYCHNNTVKFTKEYVRSLCDVKGEVYV